MIRRHSLYLAHTSRVVAATLFTGGLFVGLAAAGHGDQARAAAAAVPHLVPADLGRLRPQPGNHAGVRLHIGLLGDLNPVPGRPPVSSGRDGDTKRGSYENRHIHDGESATDAKGLVHRGLACFPSILRGAGGRQTRAACCASNRMSTSAVALAALPSGLVVLMMLQSAKIVFATLAVGLPIAIIKGFELVSAIAGCSRERARLGLGRVRRQLTQGEQPVEPSAPWEEAAHMTSAENDHPLHPWSRRSRSKPVCGRAGLGRPALRRLRRAGRARTPHRLRPAVSFAGERAGPRKAAAVQSRC